MSSRRQLRVVLARNPPDAFANCPIFPTLDVIVQCPFPGWTIEVLKMIGDSLKWDIIPVVTPTIVGGLDWGTLKENSTWSGVLGYLQNGTADAAALMYQKTDMRNEFFEFSYPVTNVQPVFVVRKKTENLGSVLWNAFKPFSMEVWLCLLASLILNLFVMIAISRVEFKLLFRERFRPFEMLWHVVQLQLDEKSDDMLFYTLGGNIVLFVFALLQSGILIEVYKGMLLTALITSNGDNPFANADEMIKLIGEKKYHLTTNYMGNWYFDDLQHSDQAHFVKLRAATSSNPVCICCVGFRDTGKYIYPIQQDSLAMQMSKERCNYVYVSDGMPQVSSFFVFTKNFSGIEEFNRQIIMNQAFIQRTFNKYFNQGFKLGFIPKCEVTEEAQSDATKPLDIESIIGVFTIGAFGISASLIAFVVEIYHYWHMRIVARRARMRDPWNVRNLARIAQIHFTTSQQYSDIDVMRLVDALNASSSSQSSSDESSSI
ncbi:Protein CBG01787 [Caenorhabditis briggsae]|uniref:Protein CBG01787 n=1 Tax=Caenorhabditis briggsae TaxID=6238 RepID=A8WQU1_CAEBR|nr:Protein CBG01787 [Caenorhabditis briggsae]CAP22849.2 Protein CBG01787 [Caenorhabditis briggsae]